LGHLFGQKQVELFLRRNHFQKVIRAHQCMKTGVEFKFINQVITVFSASHYCETVLNKSGVIQLTKKEIYKDKYLGNFNITSEIWLILRILFYQIA
jgi:hypothetical protein